ncbi:MAG: hypothetical protein ACETWR_16880 [Anaerolineae bacterium]
MVDLLFDTASIAPRSPKPDSRTGIARIRELGWSAWNWSGCGESPWPGAIDYVTKPFSIDELKLRVRNALRQTAYW